MFTFCKVHGSRKNQGSKFSDTESCSSDTRLNSLQMEVKTEDGREPGQEEHSDVFKDTAHMQTVMGAIMKLAAFKCKFQVFYLSIYI